MSVSISPLALHRSAIITRLRAAGCVYAEDEADLLISAATTASSANTASAATTAEQLQDLLDRRIAGFPLEQVLGWAWFGGLRVTICPGVFVPRARTALLVREAVARVDSYSTVIDLCCGSGAVGAAIAASIHGIRLYAADLDPAAVGCARLNLRPYGGVVYQGDLCAALPVELRGRVTVLVANVPYVPTDALDLMPAEARLYEPRLALDGGTDGLDVLRRVAVQAPAWLAPGGHLLVETSEDQAVAAAGIVRRAGFVARVVHDEDLDATVVIGAARY